MLAFLLHWFVVGGRPCSNCMASTVLYSIATSHWLSRLTNWELTNCSSLRPGTTWQYDFEVYLRHVMPRIWNKVLVIGFRGPIQGLGGGAILPSLYAALCPSIKKPCSGAPLSIRFMVSHTNSKLKAPLRKSCKARSWIVVCTFRAVKPRCAPESAPPSGPGVGTPASQPKAFQDGRRLRSAAHTHRGVGEA